jgi:hypothetical protein
MKQQAGPVSPPAQPASSDGCDRQRLQMCKEMIPTIHSYLRDCMTALNVDTENKLYGRSDAEAEHKLQECEANTPEFIGARDGCKVIYGMCGETMPPI